MYFNPFIGIQLLTRSTTNICFDIKRFYLFLIIYHLIMKNFLLVSLSLLMVHLTHGQENAKSSTIHQIQGVEVLRESPQKEVSYLQFRKDNRVSVEQIDTWMRKELLNNNDGQFFIPREEFTDKSGMIHRRYNQYYQNIPVDGSVYTIHFKDGKVHSMNGILHPDIKLSTHPKLDALTAQRKAFTAFPSEHYDIKSTHQLPELVIVPVKEGVYKLAYRTDVYSLKPLFRNNVYVDAQTGEILGSRSRIKNLQQSSRVYTQRYGVQTVMTEPLDTGGYRLRGIVPGTNIKYHTCNINHSLPYWGLLNIDEFTNQDTVWNSGYDNAALDAHYALEKCVQFYYSRYSLNSFDNLGTEVQLFVNLFDSYTNTYWDGRAIYIGDGDNGVYGPYATLETIGHEYTHAVLENVSAMSQNYFNYNDWIGLEEAVCNIMGMSIRHQYDSEFSWNFGEKVVLPGSGGAPLMSFQHPNYYGDPDTYQGNYNTNFRDTIKILNYWFYLLSEGGEGINDHGTFYRVDSIGINKATEILYHAATVYFTSDVLLTDVRYFLIQSAIDLYGPCSDEVRSVIDAWYAVGFPDTFDRFVKADFNVSSDYSCSAPATINFENLSINAASWLWDFGDGTTSTDSSPSHTYLNPGVYSIVLIAYGNNLCNVADTVSKISKVEIGSYSPVTPVSCQPGTTNPSLYSGIFEFELAQIHNYSTGSIDGYQDFTCQHMAKLIAGDPYSFFVDLGPTKMTTLYIWIDANNDGVFNNTTELVYSKSDLNTFGVNGIIQTNSNSVIGVPVRMRISTSNLPTITPCTNSSYGQIEDYSVVFSSSILPPVADFTVTDTLISKGGKAYFTNLSTQGPTTLNWSFPGGFPSTSNQPNPMVTYPVSGKYPVTLVVQNSFGSDTLIKSDYIHVEQQIYLCNGVTTTNETSGRLYDSGGPAGQYSPNEVCSLLIQPPCASKIILSFNDFLYKLIVNSYDNLRIYDGTSESDPILAHAYLNNRPQDVIATSGSMLIVHRSNSNSLSRGFDAFWQSEILSNAAPVAAFAIGNNNPALGMPVQFTNQSSVGSGDWYWDFGDGSFSVEENPVHTYHTSGNFTITLVANSCTSSNSATQNITVQPPPVANVTPDTLSFSLGCHDSITTNILIHNAGSGDLSYEICRDKPLVKILYIDFDTTEFGDINQVGYLKNYLDNSGFAFELSEPDSNTVTGIATAMQGKHIVILQAGFGPLRSPVQYKSAFQQFVANGGYLFFAGIEENQNRYVDSLDIINLDTSYFPNTFVDFYQPVEDELTRNISPFDMLGLNGSSFKYVVVSPIDSDRIELVKPLLSKANLAYFYRQYGKGKAIYWYTGFSFEEPNTTYVLENIINSRMNQTAGAILGNGSGILTSGSSASIPVTLFSYQAEPGIHIEDVSVCTNDPAHPVIVIPIEVSVSGGPEIAVSDSCLFYSNVMTTDTVRKQLTLFNNGCDTLFITGIQSNTSDFSSSTSSVVIPPYKKKQIEVFSHPNSVGSVLDTLFVFNNDHLVKICLSATAVFSPVAVIQPDTIQVSITACDDSVVVPLSFSNSGMGTLDYCIKYFHNPTVQRILVLNNEYIDGSAIQQIESIVDSLLPLSQINYITTSSPSTLASALMNADVFIISEIRNGDTSVFASFASVLANYVSGGGYVILMGTNSPDAKCLFSTGLIHGSTDQPLNKYYFSTILEEHSPITSFGCNSFTNYDSWISYLTNITDSDKVVYSTSFGKEVVVYRNIGCGRVIYFGHSLINSLPLYGDFCTPASTALLASILKRCAENSPDSSFVISQSSGTLPPGNSTSMNAVFYRNGLAPGTYTNNLLLQSNDPVNPIDTIPVIVQILPGNCFSLSMSSDSCSYLWRFNSPSYSGNVTYDWDFGDGTFSSLEDPVHSYSQTGLYNVRLILCVQSVCDTLDTLVNVYGFPPPVEICPVATQNFCCDVGILNVQFAGLNNSSGNASEGCLDFTCSDTTRLIAGQTYPLTITTSNTTPENVSVWIDFDNNGVFDPAERVLNSVNAFQTHSTQVTAPSNTITMVPLRMRVRDEYITTMITDPCSNPFRGQAEDYTVIFDGVSSINNTATIGNIEVKPNPFTSRSSLILTLNQSENVEIRLHDITGRLIEVPLFNCKLNPGTHSYELQPAEDGVYFVSIKTDSETRVLRIIKTH